MSGGKSRDLIPTRRFERAYKRYIGHDSARLQMVERALDRLRENMLDSRLKTHHLGGKLFGIYACSCGYDCRIVFKLSVDEKKKTERILLLDIGSHDEVY